MPRLSPPTDVAAWQRRRATSQLPALLQRAVALLARREHSRVELARKLMRRLDEGQDRADVDAVLDELQRRDLLSEERFAAAVVRARASRYGDARLRQDLQVARRAGRCRRGPRSMQCAAPNWSARAPSGRAASRRRRHPCRSAPVRCASWRRGASAAVIRRVLRVFRDDDSGDLRRLSRCPACRAAPRPVGTYAALRSPLRASAGRRRCVKFLRRAAPSTSTAALSFAADAQPPPRAHAFDPGRRLRAR